MCGLVYRADAPSSIKLPLPSDHSLVVVLKAIQGQVRSGCHVCVCVCVCVCVSVRVRVRVRVRARARARA